MWSHGQQEPSDKCVVMRVTPLAVSGSGLWRAGVGKLEPERSLDEQATSLRYLLCRQANEAFSKLLARQGIA